MIFMACCRPFYHQDVKRGISYPIPCGYCLNCRRDKVNQWSDRAKYEFSQKLTGSFVTLTYSDVFLTECMTTDFISGKPVATLVYKHLTDFIARLRKYVKYHPELHGVLCKPDFSYYYCGEYGAGLDKKTPFDRPHFHVLFFGLDFAFLKKVFEKEWKFGICDVLPILDGGINYVMKYMEKQYFGELAYNNYDLHNLARPKGRSSMSFGTGLFRNNAKFEYDKYNWTYPCGKNMRRPLPPYFKKQLLSYSGNFYESRRNTIQDMKTYNLRDYSSKAILAYNKRKAALRERKLYQMALRDGTPVFDFLSNSDIYFSPNYQRLKTLSPSFQRSLSDDYITQLRKVYDE